MIINVNQIDQTGTQHNLKIEMTKLAFVKHFAIAGQGYAPSLQKFFKTLGMILHYNLYIQRFDFNNHRFSEPPVEFSDPTEKAQFSTLTGKAIADFLSKRIDKSLYTVNYEAAMRLKGIKLTGPRPDLIAYSQNAVFAIEAKGRTKNNPGNMATHKMQAASGPLTVNYSVACVSYNLFNQIKCNYHDPYNDNVPYDDVALTAATKKYYKGLTGFLNNSYFRQSLIEIQGEEFYQIELTGRRLSKKVLGRFPFLYFEIFEVFRPCIILPKNIKEYAANGLPRNKEPFLFRNADEQEYLYIDNDRVGLRINP